MIHTTKVKFCASNSLVKTSLALLFTTYFEMLASLDCMHVASLACLALKPQHNLLRGLCLLVENRFCLTTIP